LAKYSVGSAVNLGDWDYDEMTVVMQDKGGITTLREEFKGGDICEGHGNKQRSAVVLIKCCKDEWKSLMAQKESVLKIGGGSGNYDLAILKSVTELEPCRYQAEVCTPEACLDNNRKVQEERKKEIKDGSLSVADIIKSVFKGLPQGCLTKEDGWWTYQYCHEQYARQYHAEYTVDTATGKYAAKLDTIHMLGLHSPSHQEDLTNNDEHLRMLNTTTSKYYTLDLGEGDVCDGDDIKGKKGIQRSAVVRFGCGDTFELLSVQEDSTCHYILDVVVQDLCDHKLFTEEIVEEDEQIVKCLPVT